LWRLAKAPTLEHFEKYAGPILAKFEKDDARQIYRVPKVASQSLIANGDLSSKRSEAGKRGARKRWQLAIDGNGKLPSTPMANRWQKIADSDSDSDLGTLPLPPPLKGGGVRSAISDDFFQKLKDDLGTAYVRNEHFEEEAYDKYFRDCWLVQIRGEVAILESTQPSVLQEGLRKFEPRLRKTFRDLTQMPEVRFEVRSQPPRKPARGNGAAA
jgi:hypothetical protein